VDSLIAVDIGGTNTRVARIWHRAGAPGPGAFEMLDAYTTPTSFDAQLARLGQVIALAQIHHKHITGVGVSVGGRMLGDGSGLAIAPNLRDYEGRPLTDDLANRTGLSVRAAHDTVCGLLGERRFGALAGSERCAYLTISTGVGAAIYLAGSGDTSGVNASIEFGHQLLDGNDRPCLCGQIGCLETYVGGRQLEMRHGASLERIADPQVWDGLVDKVALGLVNLAQLTRVELVAVGGAIALARPALLPDLQSRVDTRLRSMPLRITEAALGAFAPLAGAVALLDTDPATILN
jgi:glucokinase